MPGPKSEPTLTRDWNDDRTHFTGQRCGKTAKDHKSGKWARRLVNRHADPIRERGGKQFSK
jgi:hypothetical protein